MKKPYIIIGGGIIGSAIALELRMRDLGEVIVLEKEKEIGMHASGRNSGVIHSGINQKPGGLKAELCLRGSKMLREYCKEHEVPYEECGTLVIARNNEEEATLETLLEMGNKVGVPNLEIIGEEEMAKIEPVIKCNKALLSPTGSIVNSQVLVQSIANRSKKMGAEFNNDQKVMFIDDNKVITDKTDYEASHIINCAGLYADKIALNMGVGKDYKIIPFRGDYMEIDIPINSMVYQAPNLKYPFLGIHLTKSLDEKVLAGPTATLSWKGCESYNGEMEYRETLNMIKSQNFWRLVSGREFLKLAIQNAKVSLFKSSFVNEVNSLLKPEYQIRNNDVHQYQSGIRAQLVNRKGRMVNDFLVERGKNSTHILNAVSPGMTSSLAFVKYVVDKYIIN